MKNLSILFLLITIGCASTNNETPVTKVDSNPAAEGFNESGSDSRAIEVADATMKAMGGRVAWDAARYFVWDFFGARMLLWDKHTGDIRIDFSGQDLKIITNEKTKNSKVWKDGELLTNPDSIQFYGERGERVWINDSYWLVMPFKLKDSGVTLKYMEEDTTLTGEMCDVVRLTFEKVGVTPQNAYNVWVSKSDSLVKQWAWYVDALDSAARFTRPWDGYFETGGILLSEERGNRDLAGVKVLSEVPEGVFESFEVSLP